VSVVVLLCMSTWFGEHYCSRIPGDIQLHKTKEHLPENEENILRQMFLFNQAINFLVHLGALPLYFVMIFIKY